MMIRTSTEINIAQLINRIQQSRLMSRECGALVYRENVRAIGPAIDLREVYGGR